MVLACVSFKLSIVQGYHIPPGIVVAVLFSSILGSMLALVIQTELEKRNGFTPEAWEGLRRVPGI